MKLTITIEMGNDAFVEDAGREAARILTKLAQDVHWHGQPALSDRYRLADANGNPCGEARVTE